MSIVIGTAGWSIPKKEAQSFPEFGSALERYSARFGGVEINSSFYRPHRRSTWERWANSVPADFRFAVKIPKAVTHEKRLADCREELAMFCQDASALGSKLAIFLVQLPPSLPFQKDIAEAFFELFAKLTSVRIVCEPRHPSWFEPDAEALLERAAVARVAADPSLIDQASRPGGWRGLSYWRLHGSPVMYRSSYEEERLADYAQRIDRDLKGDHPTWCIFDNTASGAAASDALCISKLLSL